MTKDWNVQGFAFSSKEEYEKAKKEQESIAYIRANKDFKDPKKLVKIYAGLVEKDMFETVIGYAFMDQLRRHIIANELVSEELIPAIKIKKQDTTVAAVPAHKKDYKKEYEAIKQKRSFSSYLNVVLIVIIVAMFAITYYSPKNNEQVAQEKIQDQYASWQEELKQKEQQLEDREAELTKKEANVK